MIQVGKAVRYDKTGRVTCPIELANLLNLEKGKDQITWNIEGGEIIIKKVTKLYLGRYDFESEDIEERLIEFEMENGGIIDPSLSSDESRDAAYQQYCKDVSERNMKKRRLV